MDSPRGRIDVATQEATHQVNCIIMIGGIGSTIKGHNLLRKVAFARQAPARALQGFPFPELRRSKESKLHFRMVYLTCRAVLKCHRLSGSLWFFLSSFFSLIFFLLIRNV